MNAEDVPQDMTNFIEMNAELSKQWPVISQKKDPPPDADEWKEKTDKLKLLER